MNNPVNSAKVSKEITPNQDLKRCTKCGEYKSRAEGFYWKKSNVNGKHYAEPDCIDCRLKSVHNRYFSNHDESRKRVREYTAKYRAAIKNAVFEAYGGWICACCGETERAFLTLDHINNDGADFRRMLSGTQRKGGGAHTYDYLYHRNFPDGYQVLCANCNWGKRMNHGVCPHQVRRNDHPETGVGSSDPKRRGSESSDHDMISSAGRPVAVN